MCLLWNFVCGLLIRGSSQSLALSGVSLLQHGSLEAYNTALFCSQWPLGIQSLLNPVHTLRQTREKQVPQADPKKLEHLNMPYSLCLLMERAPSCSGLWNSSTLHCYFLFQVNPRHLEYARSYQDSETGETEAGSSNSLPQKVNIECMVQSSFFLPRKKLRAGSFFTILWCCPKGRDYGERMPLIFLPTLIWLISHLLGVQGSLNWFLNFS